MNKEQNKMNTGKSPDLHVINVQPNFEHFDNFNRTLPNVIKRIDTAISVE